MQSRNERMKSSRVAYVQCRHPLFVHQPCQQTRSHSLVSVPGVPAKGPDIRLMKIIHNCTSEMLTSCRLLFWTTHWVYVGSAVIDIEAWPHTQQRGTNRYPSFHASVRWNPVFLQKFAYVSLAPDRRTFTNLCFNIISYLPQFVETLVGASSIISILNAMLTNPCIQQFFLDLISRKKCF